MLFSSWHWAEQRVLVVQKMTRKSAGSVLVPTSEKIEVLELLHKRLIEVKGQDEKEYDGL